MIAVEKDEEDLELPPSDGDAEESEEDGDEGSDSDIDDLEDDASRDDAVGDESRFFDAGEVDLPEEERDAEGDLPAVEGFATVDLDEENDLLSDGEEAGIETGVLADIAEDAFAFDAGEEGLLDPEDDVREEDLPALDADDDGDFDDGRTGLVDLVHDPAVAPFDLGTEGFFEKGRKQLVWVKGALARIRATVDPGDVMGADVDGSRVALWTVRGELWSCEARSGAAKRIAESGVAGAVFVGDELLILRRQRGTLWLLVEREGDEIRELMTLDALLESVLGATEDVAQNTRIIDVAGDRAEGRVDLSTDRGVWSFRAEVGSL